MRKKPLGIPASVSTRIENAVVWGFCLGGKDYDSGAVPDSGGGRTEEVECAIKVGLQVMAVNHGVEEALLEQEL